MAVLAIDNIGHLPVTSRGCGWALTANACTHHMCLSYLQKEIS